MTRFTDGYEIEDNLEGVDLSDLNVSSLDTPGYPVCLIQRPNKQNFPWVNSPYMAGRRTAGVIAFGVVFYADQVLIEV